MPGLVGAALHRSMATVIDQTRGMRDRFIGRLIGLLLAQPNRSSNAP